MKLKDYLKTNNISHIKIASELGVSRQTIYNYLSEPHKTNFAIPSIRNMARIQLYTNNEVQPIDFIHQFEKAVRIQIDKKLMED